MSIETYPIQPERVVGKATNRRSRHKRRVNEGVFSLFYMLVELCSIYVLGLSVADYYVGTTLNELDYYPLYVTPLLIAPLILGFLFNRKGYYKISSLQQPQHVALSVMKTTAGGFILLVLLGFLAGIASEYSRIWFMTWAAGTVSTILLLRGMFASVLSRLFKLEIKTNRTAIFGDIASLVRTNRKLDPDDTNTEIVGFFSAENKTGLPELEINGDLRGLIKLAQETAIDRIIIAKDRIDRKEISGLLETLSILPCEIDIHPAFLGNAAKLSNVGYFQNSKMIRVQQKPISEWGLLAKSVFDKISAFIAVVALAPLFAVVAMAIKLDSKGPVFFRQTRHGYNQRKINVWKFRTMTVMENGDAFKQASKNDARITRLGNILRKSSIDELPQLFNVLAGDMSLVGPRPHPVALNDSFSTRLLRYNNRHKVKPGITGWAQINGYRGPTNEPGQMDKRVEFDLEYIENWSFWFDMKIILATPFYGLVGKNAF